MPGTKVAAARIVELMARLRRWGMAGTPPLGDVSPSAMALMEYVAAHPGCGVKQLAEGVGLAAPTVSVGVKRLEELGVVERQPDPADGRAVQLFLTDKGRKLHEQVLEFRMRAFSRLLEGLQPEERDELIRLLEKALDHAETPRGLTSTLGNRGVRA